MYKTDAHSCEWRFLEGGPFIHYYTLPIHDDLLFRNEEELDIAMNFIAVATLWTGVSLLAFAIMNNHLHFVLEASLERCHAFYATFQKRLKAYYIRHGRKTSLVTKAQSGWTIINNLSHLRNELAYVIRNPFVDRTSVNLFAYKWCSGYLYFNDLLPLIDSLGKPAAEMSARECRHFNRSRSQDVDSRIRVLDEAALPSSFVDYQRAMSFFESARQFVLWTLRNVEPQIAIARRMGDNVVLDDTELWSIVRKVCKDKFDVTGPKQLPNDDRIRLAQTLKYDYGASNAQIARTTGILRQSVDELFPMSASKK